MYLKKYLTAFSALTLASRFLGFIRDILIAHRLGASIFSDIFFVAFRLPNLFRSIFAEGAFNCVFLPIYSEIRINSGASQASEFAYKIQTLLIFILLTLVLVIELAMGDTVAILAPRLFYTEEKNLLLTTARIIFPYVMLISIVSLYCGILQSIKKFSAVAFCPIVLNTFLVFGLLFDAGGQVRTLYFMGISIICAGVFQLLYLLATLKKNEILPKPIKFSIDENVKKFFKRFLPAALVAEIYQINFFIDTFFASRIVYGLSYLYYADRIVQLPLALIGITLNIIILPFISESITKNDLESVVRIQNRALEIAIIFGVPATVGIILLSDNIIGTLFMSGSEFSSEAVFQTARVLRAYAMALPAYILNKVFIAVFFAKGETKTLVKFAIVSLVVNVTLNFALIHKYQHVGIAAASAFAAWINFILLISNLKKNHLFKLEHKIVKVIISVFLSTSLMIFILEILNALIDSRSAFFDIYVIKTITLVLICITGIFCYFGGLFLIKKLLFRFELKS